MYYSCIGRRTTALSGGDVAPVRSGHQFRGCATKLDFGRRNFVASCHEIHAEDGVLPSVFTPVFAGRFR